jgi:hypothetical protein
MTFRKLAGPALALSLSLPAAATEFKAIPSTERWTSVSGVADEYREILAGPNNGYSELIVWERGDEPVFIEVRSQTLSSSNPEFVRMREVKVPDAPAGASYSKVGIGNDRYITSVQVCLNNDRIKGIRLWGKVLSPNGTPKNEHDDQFALPNCMGKWKDRVSCGPDKIATGMRFYYTTDHFVHHYAFSGISLRCAKVEEA